jgi:hypothetical protein
MLEVRRSGERIDCGTGKAFGEKAAEPRAKLLASYAPLGSRRIEAEELEPAGLGSAEALHFEHNPFRGLLFHAKNAPREVPLARPQMYERCFPFRRSS